MGNMHIVTGFKGENHVTAADVGSLNAAIFGTGSYVLNRGSKLRTTTISNNKIRVADGDLMIQGRHVRLEEGTYVDLTIENGQQGYKRNDLIVARYTKNSSSGVEDVNLVVIKGTPAASSPADPAYTTGDIINDHVFLADVPLYRVPLDGLNVQTLVPLFEMASMAIEDGSVTAEKIANGAVSTDYTATIETNWSGSEAPYSKTVAINGILSSDTPFIDIDPSSTFEVATQQLEAWGYVYRAVTALNSITFYATEKPLVAIPVKVKAVRK